MFILSALHRLHRCIDLCRGAPFVEKNGTSPVRDLPFRMAGVGRKALLQLDRLRFWSWNPEPCRRPGKKQLCLKHGQQTKDSDVITCDSHVIA